MTSSVKALNRLVSARNCLRICLRLPLGSAAAPHDYPIARYGSTGLTAIARGR
jgi:hypothetical protein